MDVESLAKQLILKGMTEEQQNAVLDSIKTTMGNARTVQKQRIGENVQMVVQALKKIEADIRSRYDEVGNKIEKRVATIKDGQDGRNGVNGKDGKDGRPGRDGGTGPRGADGLNGRDGRDGDDGVSVTDAHIDFDGSLIISLSSGRTINVGEVVAPDLAEKIKVITNGGGTSQQVLDTLASLQTQIDNLIPSQTGNAGKFLTTNGSALSWGSAVGGLSYEGTWNASTNTPTLASGTGTNGYYYVVATAGSTNLDGITDWQIGDWLIFNGTVWQKIDQSNLVTSVAGRTGAVVLANTDISGLGTMSTQNANSVAITGGTATLTSLTVNDNTTLGSSNTDEVNFTARIASEFTPATDNTYDLGRVGHEWRDLYINGTANIDSLVADTADINGGSIDGTSVGATTASTGAFTTLTASGTTTLSGNQIISVTDNANAALRITQTGTGNALLVEDSTNPDSTPFVIDASGNVGIGTSSPGAKLDVNGGALIQGLTVGRGAGAVSTNTAVGASALAANTTGSLNTAFGYNALTLAAANNNSAFGYNALSANTSGTPNSAFGRSALASNTTGTSNTGIGYGAVQSNTTGGYNVGVGHQSLVNNTTASNNTAVGYQAGYSNTTGPNQVFIGYQAGYSVTTSNSHTFIGYQAGYSVTSGTDNVFIGNQAGQNTVATTTGSSNIAIGSATRCSAASTSYEIVLGFNTQGKGGSTGFINPNGGGVYQGNNSSSWSTTSDQRLKKNIVDNNTGLEKLTAIQVRNFEYRLPEEVDAELKPTDAIQKTGVQLGVIAQELQQVLPECVKTESTGVMSVDTDNLIWYAINAIKEQQAIITQLQTDVAALKGN